MYIYRNVIAGRFINQVRAQPFPRVYFYSISVQSLDWRWTYRILLIWTFVELVALVLVRHDARSRTASNSKLTQTLFMVLASPGDIHTGFVETQGYTVSILLAREYILN